MMRKFLVLLLLMVFVFPGLGFTYTKSKKKPEKIAPKEVRKPETAYEKLFKEKHEVHEGLITLHRVDDKLYFEFPVSLLDKCMLLASTVSEISDNDNALAGQIPHKPMFIKFKMMDSLVCMVRPNVYAFGKENSPIVKSLKMNNIDPIIESYEIKAKSPDGKSIVFEMTNFFTDDNEQLNPFDPYSENTMDGMLSRNERFKSKCSFIKEMKAFEENVTIKSYLTYRYDLSLMGMFYFVKNAPFTALVTRTLVLLPEEEMRSRIADPRIGFFYNTKRYYSEDERAARRVVYLNRWRLEPKDVEAYKRGELVEPLKPVVFYLDDAFPVSWRKYLKAGIESWNIAFEKIGFKGAVQVKDYPKDDPTFDPDNFKYSCVRYSPSMTENAMGPSWIDPRSGEIITASVYIYHNMVKLLHDWRFIQPAQIDPNVRKRVFDEEVTGEAIQYVIAHEVGHCLGLMHNMSASAAFPVDSLRSVTFTRKYGTTPSIMDYARFNYVAQPEDKGVKFLPPALGAYDEYAIRYAYKPILEAFSPEEEVPVLRAWVNEHVGDPIYRYGKQQLEKNYDPTSLTEDLGDDAVKASGYGIKNLKFILKNMHGWFEGEDEECEFLPDLYRTLLNQYSRYLGHVSANIGGLYLNETFKSNPISSHEPVDRKKQKESLLFILNEIKTLDWVEDQELLRKMPAGGPLALGMKASMFLSLFRRLEMVAYAASKSKEPYTPEEYLEDMYTFVWGSTMRNRKLDLNERNLQNLFVSNLKAVLKTDEEEGKKSRNGLLEKIDFQVLPEGMEGDDIGRYLEADQYNMLRNGFDFQGKINTGIYQNNSLPLFAIAQRVVTLLKSKVQAAADSQTKTHYEYLLYQFDKMMK